MLFLTCRERKGYGFSGAISGFAWDEDIDMRATFYVYFKDDQNYLMQFCIPLPQCFECCVLIEHPVNWTVSSV